METNHDERLWAMFGHLTSLCAYIGVPFGMIVGPLIVWLVKKDKMPFVDEQAKESLNFNISMTIYMIVAGLLILVLIGFILLPLLLLAHIILTIIAAVKANKGESYRYPLTIRMIS